MGLGVVNDAIMTNDLFIGGTASKPGGGSWSSSSDRRSKDIRQNYESGLTEITVINPLFYNYKRDNFLELNSDKTYIRIIDKNFKK